MDVHELAAGLWHWCAPHPEWRPSDSWGPEVSSYAVDDGEHLLLFDPLALPSEIEQLAADREATIVLTCPWHERNSRSLAERFSVVVYAPPPDTTEDLIHKFGVTAEQAGEGSPDLAWLRVAETTRWYPYLAGDRLPFGIEVFPGHEHNDLMLWIESHHAVVCGDSIVDFGDGLEINPRLRGGTTREQVAARLRPLLDRPVAYLLPTHGNTTDRAGLYRAISG